MKKHRPLSYRVCPGSAELYLPENKRCSYITYYMQNAKKSQGGYARSIDGGNMTTINIIGVVVLVGGVLGYGALFLWVLTEDKRKERKEGKKCTKASIIVTIAASGWTRGVIMSRRRLGLKEI